MRTDDIKLKNIEYMKSAPASALAIPLSATTITLNDGVSLSNLSGKHVNLVINLREYIGLDFSERYPIVVDVYVTATMAGTAALFWGALKTAVEDAIKPFGSKAPFTVGGGTSNLVITEKAQKYVAGKLSADPIHFDVSFPFIDENIGCWGKAVVAASGNTISGNYRIAELERFSYGERGDVLRETVWPNNYEPTYLMTNPGSMDAMSMLTIQYYYAGSSEDVQKSPATMYIAGSEAIVTSLASKIAGALSGNSVYGSNSGSNSGSNAGSAGGQ